MQSILTLRLRKWLAGTICENYCQLSSLAPHSTTKSDRCEEREPSAPTLFYLVKQVNESWSPISEFRCGPYNGIRRGFLWMQRWCLFVPAILRIHGATERTVWALSGAQQIQYLFKAQRCSIDVSYPHVGMDGYLVVRQSQSGVTSMWFVQWAYLYTWWQPRWIHCEPEW